MLDRRGARAGARQPPPCSLYLALQPARNYQQERDWKQTKQSSHRV